MTRNRPRDGEIGKAGYHAILIASACLGGLERGTNKVRLERGEGKTREQKGENHQARRIPKCVRVIS